MVLPARRESDNQTYVISALHKKSCGNLRVMADSNPSPQEPEANNTKPNPSHSWKVRMRVGRIKLRLMWRDAIKPFLTTLKMLLKKYAWLGFFAGAVAMVQINEYAIALFLLLLSAIALSVHIYDWKGFPERHILTGVFKTVGFLFVITLLILWIALFVKIKGSKAWSNLWAEGENPTVQSKSTPSPTYTPMPTPALIMAPTPAPTPTPEELDVDPELLLRFFRFPLVSITTKSRNRREDYGAFCWFEEQKWKDLVQVLRRGEIITLRGRITLITKERRYCLEKCEIVKRPD
jgi:hypothetical protein